MKLKGWRFWLVFSLPIQYFAFRVFASNPLWVEQYYTAVFFKYFTLGLRKLTSLTSISVGLVLVYVLSALLIFWLGKNIYQLYRSKKYFKSFAFQLLGGLSVLYFIYMLTWGLAYHKVPIEELMHLNKENITDQELIQLCEDLVEETNVSRRALNAEMIKAASLSSTFQKAPEGYQQLDYPFINYTAPSIKKAVGSDLLSYMSTSGIYMFLSGEANVNANNLAIDVPYVASHEMAHQMGFASEDEASFLGYLACKNHPDPVFRYSGNYGVVYRAIHKVWEIDSTLSKSYYNKLDTLVKQDFEAERAIWKRFKNPVQVYVVSPFYDLFLKSNGQEEGSRSYDLVIELLVAERRKNKAK